MAQVGHVLRRFVSHAAHVVMIDKKLHAAVSVAALAGGSGRKFSNISHGAVDDAAHGADLVAARLLHLLRGLAPAPDEDGDANAERGHAGGDHGYGIKTKGVHSYQFSQLLL